MASNPNEFLRLKHLNEFARQLQIKLDGGTDPKAARSISQIRFWRGGNNVTATENDGGFTVNMKRSVWESSTASPAAWLISDSFANFDCFPYLSGDASGISYTWQVDASRWSFAFSVPSVNLPWNIIFHFPENDTYAALDVPLTINITEG